MSKSINLNVRLTHAEYIAVADIAQKQSNSISEYVRGRLFTEYEAPRSQDEIRMLKSVIQIHMLIKQIAKKSLNEEEYKEAIGISKQLMEKWGYE